MTNAPILPKGEPEYAWVIGAEMEHNYPGDPGEPTGSYEVVLYDGETWIGTETVSSISDITTAAIRLEKKAQVNRLAGTYKNGTKVD